jgi:urease accessory protein
VIATSSAWVERAGERSVLHRLACEPPLTLRQVYDDDPGRCSLCLVGTAAGPLAGDELSLNLRVGAGARARLSATGASISQGRGGIGGSTMSIHAELESEASLHADPGPLIVCEGSRVDVRVGIELGTDASVEWHEMLVLGRSGDAGGAVTLRWDVTREGIPLLRQHLNLANSDLSASAGSPPQASMSLRDWPGMVARRRVLATAFVSGPEIEAITLIESPTAVIQRIDPHTALVTVLDDDAATAGKTLNWLCGQLAR